MESVLFIFFKIKIYNKMVLIKRILIRKKIIMILYLNIEKIYINIMKTYINIGIINMILSDDYPL